MYLTECLQVVGNKHKIKKVPLYFDMTYNVCIFARKSYWYGNKIDIKVE